MTLISASWLIEQIWGIRGRPPSDTTHSPRHASGAVPGLERPDPVTVCDSKRFAEPLALPTSCPPYVRDQWNCRTRDRKYSDLRRPIERVANTDPLRSSRRSAQHKRTLHRSVRKVGRRVRTCRACCRPARASGLQTAHSAWQRRRDKIPNHRADLRILRVVTGGRCWVRTNVG